MAGKSATVRNEIPPEIEAEMTPAVKAYVRGLLATVARLEARIEELETRLGKTKTTPQNSSLPPSAQHPHAKPPNRKPSPDKPRRKQGGQPGHPQQTRDLIPSAECDDVIPCLPTACRGCGRKLQGVDAAPLRHQVWELPPIQPIVVEYQQHRLPCSCCGITTCGQLPERVPQGQCGPRLAAFTGLLMGHFRQSKRRAALFLHDILNIPCSPGWVVKIQNVVTTALERPYEELRKSLTDEPQLFVDESPTKEKNQKAWLWVAVAPLIAVFGIFLNRKRESLGKLIGDYSGVLIHCDRAKMYWDANLIQWCWAHLKRDIQALIDHQNRQVQRLGHDLMRQEKRLFHAWRRYKAGEISWRTFQNLVRPIRTEFNALLLRGVFSGNRRLVGMCRELYDHRDWLWTFTQQEGIEPTNNTAERALRSAVIYRKLSFGTQSAAGSRFLERIMTVCETCRLQSRSPFQYLTEAMEASFHKQPFPSLLPSATAASHAA